ncbi:MAG: hypothetical protein QOG49_57 [Frankiaceae bacterium]|nr:hypothetical protein [Frankiaceae bacterium]
MFEHLDDTAHCPAPALAQVQHRGRQIVAQQRRTRVAVGSAALAVTGVAGISIATRTTPTGVAGVAAAGKPVSTGVAAASKPVSTGAAADAKSPAAKAGGTDAKAQDGTLAGKPFVAGSAAFTRECTSAYDAMKPAYLPAGFALATEQAPSGNRVDVPGRTYENADHTRFFQVAVVCIEDGAAAEQPTAAGTSRAVIENVTVGGHAAVLASYEAQYSSVSWLLSDHVLVRVQTKAPSSTVQIPVSDDELLKVAASLPAK